MGWSHADRSVAPAMVAWVMPYAVSSAPPGAPHSGLVAQSVARPHLILSWTAVVSLILARLFACATSARTTKPF